MSIVHLWEASCLRGIRNTVEAGPLILAIVRELEALQNLLGIGSPVGRMSTSNGAIGVPLVLHGGVAQ
jgi:hypothetical protein